MIRDMIVALVSSYVIEPAQAELNERLAAARAPQAVIEQVTACARDAAPAILKRAGEDWGWAVTMSARVATGLAPVDAVLVEVAPSCGPAMSAARPFLDGSGT